VIFPPRKPREGMQQHRRRRGKPLLDPALEHAAEPAERIGLGQFLKHRIDTSVHRTAAQQLCTESVDGAR